MDRGQHYKFEPCRMIGFIAGTSADDTIALSGLDHLNTEYGFKHGHVCTQLGIA